MKSSRLNRFGMFCIMGVVIIGLSHYVWAIFQAPQNFPIGKNFVVQENETVQSISNRLEDDGYITSSLLFRAGVSFLGKDRDIKLGGYTFDNPLSLSQIIIIFATGKTSAPLLRVTIPEGSTLEEITMLIHKALPSISKEFFIQAVKKYDAQGKLFPSTYFLLPSYSAEDIIEKMLATFSKKTIERFALKIPSPLQNEHDVLVLASILEGEAKTKEDMEIVSGILLNRLRAGMLLQVDVAMETYKQKGLPPQPINNPGLVAIDAVLQPTFTDYFYYITGNDGKMYYAKTFEEHKKNIRKYLK